eukprot:5203757-Pyramimonas_sp.AAC.1
MDPKMYLSTLANGSFAKDMLKNHDAAGPSQKGPMIKIEMLKSMISYSLGESSRKNNWSSNIDKRSRRSAQA